jgi:hypothetical protein
MALGRSAESSGGFVQSTRYVRQRTWHFLTGKPAASGVANGRNHRGKKAQDPALAQRFRRKCLGEAADAWVY